MILPFLENLFFPQEKHKNGLFCLERVFDKKLPFFFLFGKNI